ncbi:hypothetical protein GBF35_01845 [Nonomuraea phyllanthi]|uniref:hypothetical protein n=1 Tax=Nonomuraea phyllanthi TaxID=2219224 RepID=UPI001292E90C|nr:hypothetical protein [Nonomuraea phyllanthi]QFY05589.1 hypothetical protein GBF35_01845 [Nonomuraea phyllanthi]
MTLEVVNTFDVRPIFREAGYLLSGLNWTLEFAAALRVPLRSAEIGIQGPCPDVTLKHASNHYLLLECKKSSFGASSSTALQAQKLLIVGSDMGPSTGNSTSIPATVTYVMPEDQLAAQLETLSQLRSHLVEVGFPCADYSTIGISWDGEGIWLRFSCPSDHHLHTVLEEPQLVIKSPPGERPLYIIPYDPSVTQDEEEKQYCLTQLSQRLHTAAWSEIGRANVPSMLNLYGDRLLNIATYGAFDYWRGSDRKNYENKAIQVLASTFKGVAQKHHIVRQASNPNHLELDLSTEVNRDIFLDCLHKANPASRVGGFTETQEELNLGLTS